MRNSNYFQQWVLHNFEYKKNSHDICIYTNVMHALIALGQIWLWLYGLCPILVYTFVVIIKRDGNDIFYWIFPYKMICAAYFIQQKEHKGKQTTVFPFQYSLTTTLTNMRLCLLVLVHGQYFHRRCHRLYTIPGFRKVQTV